MNQEKEHPQETVCSSQQKSTSKQMQDERRQRPRKQMYEKWLNGDGMDQKSRYRDEQWISVLISLIYSFTRKENYVWENGMIFMEPITFTLWNLSFFGRIQNLHPLSNLLFFSKNSLVLFFLTIVYKKSKLFVFFLFSFKKLRTKIRIPFLSNFDF